MLHFLLFCAFLSFFFTIASIWLYMSRFLWLLNCYHCISVSLQRYIKFFIWQILLNIFMLNKAFLGVSWSIYGQLWGVSRTYVHWPTNICSSAHEPMFIGQWTYLHFCQVRHDILSVLGRVLFSGLRKFWGEMLIVLKLIAIFAKQSISWCGSAHDCISVCSFSDVNAQGYIYVKKERGQQLRENNF